MGTFTFPQVSPQSREGFEKYVLRGENNGDSRKKVEAYLWFMQDKRNREAQLDRPASLRTSPKTQFAEHDELVGNAMRILQRYKAEEAYRLAEIDRQANEPKMLAEPSPVNPGKPVLPSMLQPNQSWSNGRTFLLDKKRIEDEAVAQVQAEFKPPYKRLNIPFTPVIPYDY